MTNRGMVKTNETMEEFANNCIFRLRENGGCSHPKKFINHCLSEKKYCPRVAKSEQKEKPLWKTDYDLYLEQHDKIFENVILSESFINPLEIRYPKYNIRAILEENREYWRSKSPKKGYHRKCKTESKNIDWPETYKNSVIRSIRYKYAVPKESVSW